MSIVIATIVTADMTTNQVWHNYANELKQFIISKVKNTTIADDILQDTFVKIHTKFHTLNDIKKIKPWIFSIARNEVFNYFKSQKKSEVTTYLETENEIDQKKHTEKDCLRAIVSNLPKKYRNPIYYSDIKGVKHTEISALLNIPLPTVKSQIQRARKQIVQGFIACCGLTTNAKGKLIGKIKEKENCKVCS